MHFNWNALQAYPSTILFQISSDFPIQQQLLLYEWKLHYYNAYKHLHSFEITFQLQKHRFS